MTDLNSAVPARLSILKEDGTTTLLSPKSWTWNFLFSETECLFKWMIISYGYWYPRKVNQIFHVTVA